jgi:hypothetical protein
MPVYRRIIEVDTGVGGSIFRTVRVDCPEFPPDPCIVEHFSAIIENFALRYETMVRFVPPRAGQIIPGYYPKIPGETTWDFFEVDPEEP